MQTHNPNAFIALAGALLLSACDALPTATPSADPSQAIGLRAPSTLTTSRAVDTQSLYPRVELIDADGNRIVVDMQRGAENQWSGNTRLMANADYRLAVTWHETVNDRDLVLAAHVRTLHTGADGTRLSLGTDDYDFDADADGDGLSNLQELEAGSDPFDASSGIDVDTTDPSDTTDVTGSGSSDTPNEESGTPSQNGTSTGTSAEHPTDAASVDTTGDETPVVVIPRIARDAAPLLDGLVGAEFDDRDRLPGEWGPAAQTDTSGALLGINHLLIDNRAEAPDGTPYRRWAAMHDGDSLYLLILVDDVGQRSSDSLDARDDDSVELSLSAGYASQPTDDEADRWHLILPLLPLHDSAPNTESGRFDTGPESTAGLPDFSFVTGPGVGPDGIRLWRWEQDVYEIRIALDTLGIAPGDVLGLSLQVNDDDDGGARDSQWGWSDPAQWQPVRLAP